MEKVTEMPHINCQRILDCIEVLRRYKIFLQDRTEIEQMVAKVQSRVESIKKAFTQACRVTKKKKAYKEMLKKVTKQQLKQQEEGPGV